MDTSSSGHILSQVKSVFSSTRIRSKASGRSISAMRDALSLFPAPGTTTDRKDRGLALLSRVPLRLPRLPPPPVPFPPLLPPAPPPFTAFSGASVYYLGSFHSLVVPPSGNRSWDSPE